MRWTTINNSGLIATIRQPYDFKMTKKEHYYLLISREPSNYSETRYQQLQIWLFIIELSTMQLTTQIPLMHSM